MKNIQTELAEPVKRSQEFADLIRIADKMFPEPALEFTPEVNELLSMPDEQNYERLVDMHDVMEMTTLSRRTILNMEERNEFPRRYIVSGRRKAWKLSEVVAWINNIPLSTNHPMVPVPVKPSCNLKKKVSRARKNALAGKSKFMG